MTIAGSGQDCSTCKLIDLKVVVCLLYVAVDTRWVDCTGGGPHLFAFHIRYGFIGFCLKA